MNALTCFALTFNEQLDHLRAHTLIPIAGGCGDADAGGGGEAGGGPSGGNPEAGAVDPGTGASAGASGGGPSGGGAASPEANEPQGSPGTSRGAKSNDIDTEAGPSEPASSGSSKSLRDNQNAAMAAMSGMRTGEIVGEAVGTALGVVVGQPGLGKAAGGFVGGRIGGTVAGGSFAGPTGEQAPSLTGETSPGLLGDQGAIPDAPGGAALTEPIPAPAPTPEPGGEGGDGGGAGGVLPPLPDLAPTPDIPEPQKPPEFGAGGPATDSTKDVIQRAKRFGRESTILTGGAGLPNYGDTATPGLTSSGDTKSSRAVVSPDLATREGTRPEKKFPTVSQTFDEIEAENKRSGTSEIGSSTTVIGAPDGYTVVKQFSTIPYYVVTSPSGERFLWNFKTSELTRDTGVAG